MANRKRSLISEVERFERSFQHDAERRERAAAMRALKFAGHNAPQIASVLEATFPGERFSTVSIRVALSRSRR